MSVVVGMKTWSKEAGLKYIGDGLWVAGVGLGLGVGVGLLCVAVVYSHSCNSTG